MYPGSDCINAQLAAPVLVRAEGRTLHRVFVRSYADGHGGSLVGVASQGHALHGNVRLLTLFLLDSCFILTFSTVV